MGFVNQLINERHHPVHGIPRFTGVCTWIFLVVVVMARVLSLLLVLCRGYAVRHRPTIRITTKMGFMSVFNGL